MSEYPNTVEGQIAAEALESITIENLPYLSGPDLITEIDRVCKARQVKPTVDQQVDALALLRRTRIDLVDPDTGLPKADVG